ncbi:MAG TPA: exonuclease SbcCD subunit D [Actinomycetota bacterium]|nr:exonuclease SbcCD subunit D [Actinomycetota bacterium]
MKLLHTSDWHVGKTVRGRDRSDEHRAVLDEITGIARAHAVDLVIVAGDLFESAAPTPDAERIVYRALLDLAEVAPVVVVSGNHDNDRRLIAVEPLLGLGRITTRAMLAKPDEGGVLTLDTAAGERAQIALLPWVSQRYIVRAEELMAKDAFEHAGDYAQRLADVIGWLCKGFSDDTVNIVAGHAMVAGGVLGGGERTAHTYFDYYVSPTAFPTTAHYVALGHLHRAQRLGSQPPVWYCGSPLQMDFGETEDRKCALVVEATATTPAHVEQIALSSGRSLRKITGAFEDLETLGGTTGDDYLCIVVRGEARAGLAEDVREIFGENAVDVRIQTDADAQFGLDPRAHETRSPKELFREYLAEKKVNDERVLTLFDELFEEEHAASPA